MLFLFLRVDLRGDEMSPTTPKWALMHFSMACLDEPTVFQSRNSLGNHHFVWRVGNFASSLCSGLSSHP